MSEITVDLLSKIYLENTGYLYSIIIDIIITIIYSRYIYILYYYIPSIYLLFLYFPNIFYYS